MKITSGAGTGGLRTFNQRWTVLPAPGGLAWKRVRWIVRSDVIIANLEEVAEDMFRRRGYTGIGQQVVTNEMAGSHIVF